MAQKHIDKPYTQDYAEKYYKYWQRLIPDRFKPDFYNPDIYPKIWDYQTKDIFVNFRICY